MVMIEQLLPEVGIFLFSLVILIVSSEIILESSIKFSKRFGIGEFAIGFILIAIATSLPELAVTFYAAIADEGGLIVGNVIGSNISNILLVLGLGTIFGSLYIRQRRLIDSSEILLLITIIPLLLLGRGSIGLFGGAILIVMFILYSFFVSTQDLSLGIKASRKKIKILPAIILFVIGLLFLLFSANLVVTTASSIATIFGVSTSIIGLTIVAVGTSLPELVTTLAAIRRGRGALALGNILGSCVANLTLVLGVGAMLATLTLDAAVFHSSTIFLLIATTLLTYVLFKYRRITPMAGFIFIILYIIFIFSELGIVPAL